MSVAIALSFLASLAGQGGVTGAHSKQPAIQDCSSCPKMIVIEGGMATIGSPKDEKDRHPWEALQHQVAVSKFAIEGLSQVLADELQPAGVRVNCVNPGRARTNMRLQAYPAEDRSAVPEPTTLVGSYLYLLGPASRGITGQSFDCQ